MNDNFSESDTISLRNSSHFESGSDHEAGNNRDGDDDGGEELVKLIATSNVDEPTRFSQTPEGHGVSTTKATVNIVKCFVGAASMELPWAFSQAGMWPMLG